MVYTLFTMQTKKKSTKRKKQVNINKMSERVRKYYAGFCKIMTHQIRSENIRCWILQDYVIQSQRSLCLHFLLFLLIPSGSVIQNQRSLRLRFLLFLFSHFPENFLRFSLVHIVHPFPEPADLLNFPASYVPESPAAIHR